MEQAVEGDREAARFLLGVHSAVPQVGQGQGRAQYLVHFLVGQVAYVVGEESQPVQLAEQHIHRQTDTEHLRNLAQPRVQVAGRRRQGFVGAGLEKSFGIDAHDHAARRLCPAEEPALGRLQALHQPHPAAGLAQEAAAGFHEDRFVRQPDIHRTGRHQIAVLIHLAGQQVRLDARVHEEAGLGGASLAYQKIDRHVAQAGLLADRRVGQPIFGVAHEGFDFPIVRGGCRLRLLRLGLLLPLLSLPQIVEQAKEGEHQPHEERAHNHFGHARQVQQSSNSPGDHQKGHHEDSGDDVVP